MGKMINLKNQRFGFWLALEPAEKNTKGQTQWLCQCECGVKKIVTTNSLRTGNSTSCGCNHTPDLTNIRFGKLLVLKQDNSKSNGRRHWVCQCDCSNLITVNTYQLRNDKISSCGCDNAQTINNNLDIISNSALLNQLNKYKENIDQIYKNCLLAQENYKVICDKINTLSKLFSA